MAHRAFERYRRYERSTVKSVKSEILGVARDGLIVFSKSYAGLPQDFLGETGVMDVDYVIQELNETILVVSKSDLVKFRLDDEDYEDRQGKVLVLDKTGRGSVHWRSELDPEVVDVDRFEFYLLDN